MSELFDLARGVILTGVADARPESIVPGFAGYIVFERNGESVPAMRAFTDHIRRRCAAGEPPLIAIDQEGGRVRRLRDGAEAIPSMMELGTLGDVELVQETGERIARDLRRAGCTMNFAPVLDLAVDPRNTVIGTRSFGPDPQAVAAFGAALARGLQKGGIVPCYKHFPGHGATAVDSHDALPRIEIDEATLRARDLVPFAAVARDAAAIMSAHVVVECLDPDRPATLSRRILTDLLRGELGFRGALVTDCLEMGALAAVEPAHAAVQALAAGADLLLFSHHVELAEAAAVAIEQAVAEGHVPLERLTEARTRVRALSVSS